MNFSLNHMVYAALMHDIGKLIQRTGAADTKNPKYTSMCRTHDKGKYLTHKHVMWTAEFLDKYPLPIEDWDSISEVAGCHHNASAQLQGNYSRFLDYLMQADRISSSWDRDESEDDNTGSYRYRKVPLYSIFDTITVTGNKSAADRGHHYLPQPKTPQSVLNLKTGTEMRDMKAEYSALFQAFESDYRQVHSYYKPIAQAHHDAFTGDYFPAYIDAVDSLLEKYLWYVPANTMETKPVCSLYHHVRNTACIASALFAAHEIYKIDASAPTESKPFMLIGCDLNGIQSYLYDLNPENSQKSAKQLRARSFQIKTVLDLLGQWIIDELQLSRFNILTNAAGKLIILAPSHPSAIAKLITLKQQMDQQIFSQFLGMLSINLSCDTQIGLAELDKYNFMQTMTHCIESLETCKLTRFQTTLTTDGKWNPESFVINHDKIHNADICPFCKRRIAGKTETSSFACHECAREIHLGEILVKKHLFRIYRTETPDSAALLQIGSYCLRAVNDVNSPSIYPHTFYFDIRPQSGAVSHFAVKPTASIVPVDADGIPLDFAQIAAGATGIPANAIIKGDVDDLGKLFQKGLFRLDEEGKKKCSITEYTAFSSLMDYFFSVVVPEIISSKYQDSIYTVYSGGDDFCLVGAWDQIIAFGREIQKTFGIYTATNPEIHFTAAICMLHPKAPIRFAILDTEEQLKKAKNLKPLEKNRLYLFETIVKWSDTAELFAFATKLEGWLSKDTGVTKQFLYRLLAYHEMYLETQKAEHALHNHLYDAMLQYDIKRNIDQHKHREKLTDNDINDLRRVSTVDDVSILSKLRIPVCLILYKNR